MKNTLNRLRVLLRRISGKTARAVWISHPVFDAHAPGKEHPESPLRIDAIKAELQRQNIWSLLQTAEAKEIDDKELARVHPRKYLRFLENHQPPAGKIYRIDGDTVMSHDSIKAARFAAGAVVGAVDMVMANQARHAFCAVRPPGHHAHSDKAGGFCLINSAAVGVMHAIAEYRLQRIALIDFDVHFGDGSAEIFKDDPRILLFNSFETNLFPFPPADTQPRRCKNIVNTPLPSGTGSRNFRNIIRKEWLPKLDAFKPELVMISAGFDGHEHDETGRLNLHETDFAWLTHKIVQTASSCSGRIVSVLEGGYTLGPLAKSAAAHIQVLAGMPKSAAAALYEKSLKQ